MRGLQSRVVIVTGGGGGIGSATCKRLAQEGAAVAVCDINIDAARSTCRQITDADGTAAAFELDITDHDAARAALAAIETQLGPVAALVNNAGWDAFAPFLKTTPETWNKLISINLIGALNMHHVVLPGMVERGYGRVVNVASDAARVGSSGEAVYAACKAGLVGLSKTLAREHARHGISVNVVCPGATDTALLSGVLEGSSNPDKLREAFRKAIPMGRLGQPDDLAGAIAFLASDDATFITGQVLSVSGGLTMNG